MIVFFIVIVCFTIDAQVVDVVKLGFEDISFSFCVLKQTVLLSFALDQQWLFFEEQTVPFGNKLFHFVFLILTNRFLENEWRDSSFIADVPPWQIGKGIFGVEPRVNVSVAELNF